MASVRDKCLELAILACRHGGSWWMPVLLLMVSAVNSITGGVFIWSIGVLQASLFPIVVMSRKYTFWIGPLVLCCGSMIGAFTYIHLMKTQGADALLEKTGAKGSQWLEKTKGYAVDYGVMGLLFLQVVPIPIPTAVIVVAGMLAEVAEYKILLVVLISKFVQLTAGAVGLKFLTENMTPEEYIRQTFMGEEGGGKEDEAKKEGGKNEEKKPDDKKAGGKAPKGKQPADKKAD